MLHFARTAAIGAALLAPGGASAAILGFDGLDASAGQTVPLTTFSEGGYTFFLSSSGGLGAAIFDTTCSGSACNGDPDLIPAVQGENGVGGNVLILQDTSGGTPNDFPGGGTIEFTLTSGPSFFLKGFSAIDDGQFTAFDIDNSVLGVINNGNVENKTGLATFTSQRINVGDTFSFGYSGSGGIDSLVTAPVPVPAALPLALAAFGALGWVGRRKT